MLVGTGLRFPLSMENDMERIYFGSIILFGFLAFLVVAGIERWNRRMRP